jgi:hypothetical protein
VDNELTRRIDHPPGVLAMNVFDEANGSLIFIEDFDFQALCEALPQPVQLLLVAG